MFWCNVTFKISIYGAVFNAQLVPSDLELITDVVFPEFGNTQITIPAGAIVYQRSIEGV